MMSDHSFRAIGWQCLSLRHLFLNPDGRGHASSGRERTVNPLLIHFIIY